MFSVNVLYCTCLGSVCCKDNIVLFSDRSEVESCCRVKVALLLKSLLKSAEVLSPASINATITTQHCLSQFLTVCFTHRALLGSTFLSALLV